MFMGSPLTPATSDVFGALFLHFVAVPMCFAINAHLGDVHCYCLDPAVPLGTPVVSS